MQDTKPCIICHRYLTFGRFFSGYQYCRECSWWLHTIRQNVYCLINRSLTHGTSSSVWKFLPYTREKMKTHLESQFEPWMNWDNRKQYKTANWKDNDISTWVWQIDHIIPQCAFIFTSIQDEMFAKCWDLNNLRPLSAKENYIKGNRVKL